MSALWKLIDLADNPPFYLSPDDACYHAREYTPRGGFGCSDTNDLIINFKKGVERKANTSEWNWKERAIKKFAEELTTILPDDTLVAAMVTSKCLTDPAYDSRLVDTLRLVKQLNPSLTIVTPIETIQTVQSAHKGGPRHPDPLYLNLEWIGGIPRDAADLVIIDDVISSGAHFTAARRLIRQHHPVMTVHGVFWARSIEP